MNFSITLRRQSLINPSILTTMHQLLVALLFASTETNSIVQTIRLTLPKLHHSRLNQISSPVRKRNFLLSSQLLLDAHLNLIEIFTIRNDVRLRRSERTNLTWTRTWMKVKLRLFPAQFRCTSLNPDGTSQRKPVESDRNIGIRCNILGFATCIVGEECEAFAIEAFEQNVAVWGETISVMLNECQRESGKIYILNLTKTTQQSW